MSTNCAMCGRRIDGPFIGSARGEVHPRCWYRANPPRVAASVGDVLGSLDDPSLARSLVAQILTPEQGSDLVRRYNRMMAEAHARRIAEG